MNFFNNKTIGSFESFTGGLFAETITRIPGASKYFKGSIISYSNEIKEKFGIDTSKGVVNKETALAMTKIGKKFLNVDICVSFTGIAGPNTIDNQHVGKTFMAINDVVYEKDFVGTREEIRKSAVNFIFKKINK